MGSKAGNSIAFEIASSPADRPRRPLAGALLFGFTAVIVLIAIVDWLDIGTQRLYLGDPSRQSGPVSQLFVQIGQQVTPEITTSGEARFAFPIHVSTPHKLVFTALPEGNCAFEIDVVKGASRNRVSAAQISRCESRALSIPPCEGRLEFVTHGRMVWRDLRLVRAFFLWPLYATGLLALGVIGWKWRRSFVISARAANWVTLAVSVVICLTLSEITLRSLALKLPHAILDERRSLGLIVPEPLLQNYEESAKYYLRLRPNIKTDTQWRFGNIARMGVIPESVAPGVRHRYPFETDAEGFRNASVRAKIDVAALGDSFTEGLMSPVGETWPAQLEKLTGWTVQNYGNAAFGPQQELYVLRDYAIKRQPRVTVLAFFAGNDLHDAEAFDHWQHFSKEHGKEKTGWKITESFRNYEALYICSIAQVGARLVLPRSLAGTGDGHPAAGSGTHAHFDRGMFAIPVKGKVLRFAWAPWYLLKLGWSPSQYEQSRGWELTHKTLVEMNSTCAKNGSRLVLMFIPSAEQVYWPLAERSLGPAELQQAVDFYMSNRVHLNLKKISANRLAQNKMLADFCARENIPMLDLTPALERKVESGTIIYFPDDEHWNSVGHEVAATELAAFLGRLP